MPDQPFYHTAKWKRLRQVALSRDGGLCAECLARYRAGYGKKPRRAEVVHHIIPIDVRPDLALDLSNLRCLCAECHNKIHPEKGRGRTAKTEESHVNMRVIKC